MGVIWALCDLVKKGMKRMKRGLGIIPFYSRLGIFLKILLLGGRVCDIKRGENNMETNCTFNLVMENGWWILICLVGVWFYLEYDRKLGNVVHIKTI
jgi:hypothetical protein